MDRADLEAEIIRAGIETAVHAADLQARRHVAVLAVALASAVTTMLAGLASQIGLVPAGVAASGLVAVSAMQVRALGKLTALLRATSAAAMRDLRRIETLIVTDGEPPADGEA